MPGLQTFFLVLLAGCAVAALSVRDLMAAVIVFACFSFFAAILYALMNALDVSFIEAVVGVVTTVFFVSTLQRTGRRTSR